MTGACATSVQENVFYHILQEKAFSASRISSAASIALWMQVPPVPSNSQRVGQVGVLRSPIEVMLDFSWVTVNLSIITWSPVHVCNSHVHTSCFFASFYKFLYTHTWQISSRPTDSVSFMQLSNS